MCTDWGCRVFTAAQAPPVIGGRMVKLSGDGWSRSMRAWCLSDACVCVLMADVVQQRVGALSGVCFKRVPFLSSHVTNQHASCCMTAFTPCDGGQAFYSCLVKLEQGLAAQHAVERVVLFLPWLLAHWSVLMHMHTLGLVLTAPMGVAARGSGIVVARNCHSRACMLALPR